MIQFVLTSILALVYAACCMLLGVLAADYETIGHGLHPVAAMLGVLVMSIMASVALYCFNVVSELVLSDKED